MSKPSPLAHYSTGQLEAEIKARQEAENLETRFPKNFKGAKALLAAILDSYDISDAYERSIDFGLINFANEYLAEKK